MVTLYYAPSTASFVVHWLMIELDVPHELRRLDTAKRDHKTPEYLALNPSGVIPTAIVDGEVVTEAAAIAMHLADRDPATRFAPAPGTPARAQYYRWMFFCSNTLQPAYRGWFYPYEPAGEAHAEAAKDHSRARVEAAWDIVAAHLAERGPYMLGERVTTVDFMVTMLMRWSRNMPRPSDRWPALQAFARAMKQRPTFAEVYRREGLTDWA